MAVRAKKWLKWLLLTLLVLLLLAGMCIAWLLGTASGGTWLLNTALPYARNYTPSYLQWKAEGVAADTVADIRIAHLQFMDEEGIWLEAEALQLLWQPFRLMRGEVAVDTLSSAKIHFLRPPVIPNPELPPPLGQQITAALKEMETLPGQLRRLTLPPLHIGKLDMPDIRLDTMPQHVPTRFSLQGELNLLRAPFAGEIRLQTAEGVFTTASLSIEGKAADDARLILQWREQEGGLLGHYLQWQKPTFSHITLALSLQKGAITAEGAVDAGEQPFMGLSLSGSALEARVDNPSLSLLLPGFSDPLVLKAQFRKNGVELAVSTPRYSLAEGTLLQPVTLKTTLEITETDIPFSLQAALETILQQEGKELPLSAEITAKGDAENWQFEKLALRAAGSRLDGSATIGLASGKVELEGEVFPAADGLPEAAKALLTAPIHLKAKLENQQIRLNAHNDAWQAEGGFDLNARNGNASLTVGALTLSGDYHLQETLLRISPVSLQAKDGSIRLAGELSLDTGTTLATGTLKGHIRSLTPLAIAGWTPPALQAEKGEVALALSAPGNIQQAKLQADMGGLDIEDGTVNAEQVKLLAEAALPPGKNPQLNATLDMGALSTPVTSSNLHMTAKGDTGALNIQLKTGQLAEMFDLSAQAGLMVGETIRLALQKLEVQSPEYKLVLKQPSQLTIKGEELTLAKTLLELNGKAQITAEAALDARNAKGALTIGKLPFNAIPAAQLKDINGWADAALRLSGSRQQPVVELLLQAEAMPPYPETSGNLPAPDKPLTLHADAKIAAGTLNAQLRAADPNGKSGLKGTLNMPFTLSLAPGAIAAKPGDTLKAEAEANLILADFLPFLAPNGIYGDGRLSAILKAEGALSSPQIQGQAELRDASLEVASTGTVLKNIYLKANADTQRITLSEGRATDGGAGRLTLSGFINLGEATPMQASLDFKQMTLINRPEMNALLSGNLALSGTQEEARLAGRIALERARISIAGGQSGKSVPEMEVREVASLDIPVDASKQDDDSPAKQKRLGGFAERLALDVRIEAPNQIFLEGYGLDAELKAALHVQGTAAAPQPGGKMQTLRGKWDFLGRSFTITRGEATLRQENISNPLLDIEAEAKAGDITAVAALRGSANQPQISFTSVPALPQDEVLARIMFGKNLNSISPLQALELAQMLRSLSSGEGGSISTVSKIKDAVGIDDLTVGSGDENGDMTVGVGKHVSDNIYLGVEGGAGQDSGKVSLEVDLTPNISVETEARQNADTAVRLNYKYDY